MTDLPPMALVILVLLVLDHTGNHAPAPGHLRLFVEMPFATIIIPIVMSVEVSALHPLEILMAESDLYLLCPEQEALLVPFLLLDKEMVPVDILYASDLPLAEVQMATMLNPFQLNRIWSV